MAAIADVMFQFAKWSEATPLGKAIRNSEYAFPMIEFVHLAALAVIGGAVLIVDMRLLGLGLKKTSVAELARDAQPYVTGSLIVVAVLAASALTGHLGAQLPLGAHQLGPVVLHPLSLAYLAVGCGMVSKRLHIPKP